MVTLTILFFIVFYFRSRSIKMENVSHYEVLQKEDSLELRKYKRSYKASVILSQALKKRVHKGFQILLAYIQGNNRSKS